MVKKVVQRGRSEQGLEAYFVRYVEGPSDARTKLEAFFTIRQDDHVYLRHDGPVAHAERWAQSGRSYEYDKARNLAKFTDRKNQVATFAHDSLNRRTSAT